MVEIRTARSSDAEAITQLEMRGFKTALSKFLGWTHPVKYIEAVNGNYSGLLDPKSDDYVAYDEHNAVIGFATFYLAGRTVVKPTSWLGQLEASLFAWQRYFSNLPLYLRNKATLRERDRRVEIFKKAKEDNTRRLNESQSLDKYLYLSILVIDPEYQGKGVGTRLIQICIDEAQKQDIPLVLESTKRGYDFYMHKGFKEVGEALEVWDGDKLIDKFPNVILYPRAA